MLTDIEFEFLKKVINGELTKEDNPKRYSIMMIRIQERVDDGIKKLIWIVENCPELLKDEVREINDCSLERYRRFKAFAYITSKLNPMTELEEVDLVDIIKKLSQLYPKYYIELVRKDKDSLPRI